MLHLICFLIWDISLIYIIFLTRIDISLAYVIFLIKNDNRVGLDEVTLIPPCPIY